MVVMRRGGVLLREWLRAERRTQEWLAEQIGSHQTNISAWIRGRPIPVDAAVAIKRITGITVEEWTIEADESGSLGEISSTGT